MEIRVTSDHEHLELAAVGELDASNVDHFRESVERVADGRDGTLVLDLSDLSFIDSSGVSALLTLHEARTGRGARLVLSSPSDPVARVLELTGLTDVFEIS